MALQAIVGVVEALGELVALRWEGEVRPLVAGQEVLVQQDFGSHATFSVVVAIVLAASAGACCSASVALVACSSAVPCYWARSSVPVVLVMLGWVSACCHRS